MASLDGTTTVRRLAESMCRIVAERAGDSSDPHTITHEANARFFGKGVPPEPPYRRFTERRARVVSRAWELAVNVGFDPKKL